MVPPMVEALLFPVKPVPLGKREIFGEQSLFTLYFQRKVEISRLCFNAAFLIGDMLSAEAGCIDGSVE